MIVASDVARLNVVNEEGVYQALQGVQGVQGDKQLTPKPLNHNQRESRVFRDCTGLLIRGIRGGGRHRNNKEP